MLLFAWLVHFAVPLVRARSAAVMAAGAGGLRGSILPRLCLD
jgi:hypothetical protein